MTDDPAAALLERLRHGDGARLLASLPPYDEDASLALMTRLRAEGHAPELVSAALTQSRLRARARARIGPLADRLLLTQDGVEQATRPAVSERRAELLAQVGVEHVLDLGCGLGLDAIALAEAGLTVTAVERDPVVAAAAAANLAPWAGARVVLGDASAVPVRATDGAFLDPARRTPGVADARGRSRRVFRLADLSPSFETVLGVARRARVTVAKLAPGFPRSEVPADARAEWVSLDGDLLECALWWGAGPPGRHALVGRSGPAGVVWHELGPTAAPAPALDRVESLGAWLAEPDPAVGAAGLTGTLASALGGHELAPGAGYVSCHRRVELPWVRWYAVREVLPLHAGAVRRWLRGRPGGAAGPVTIKKRGVPTDPDAFRAQLRLPRRPGGDEVVLVLTTVADTPRALVVEPS